MSSPVEPARGIERVLLVDDEPDIRQIAELSLRAVGGFSVTTAGSGEQAVAIAQRCVPDVILLDVMMPLCDGPTTLRRLRELPAIAAVPVIFMTAKAQKHEIERYLGLGAAGVIVKPFDPMSLAAEVRRIAQPIAAAAVIARGLPDLRDDYAARLPEKLAAIAGALAAAEADTKNPALLGAARRLAHRLHGTAGAYGFSAIGEAAARIEAALGDDANHSLHPPGSTAPRFTEAHHALAQARALLPRSAAETTPPQK